MKLIFRWHHEEERLMPLFFVFICVPCWVAYYKPTPLRLLVAGLWFRCVGLRVKYPKRPRGAY